MKPEPRSELKVISGGQPTALHRSVLSRRERRAYATAWRIIDYLNASPPSNYATPSRCRVELVDRLALIVAGEK